MSEMKALDRLYKFLEDQFGSDRFAIHGYGYTQGMAIAKLIEAEIAGNYMRLPCDADRMPIHIGDKLVKDGEVIGNVTAVGFHDGPRVWVLPNGKHVSVSFLAGDVKHHTPRTLEDVLCDVWKEALDYAKSDIWRNPDEVFAERSAEIRELLGGNAE